MGTSNGLVKYPDTPRLAASIALSSVEKPVITTTGSLSVELAGCADHRQAVQTRHLQVSNQEAIPAHAHTVERVETVGGYVHIVVSQRERLRQQVADALLVVDHKYPRPSGRARSLEIAGRAVDSGFTPRLTLEPLIDV